MANWRFDLSAVTRVYGDPDSASPNVSEASLFSLASLERRPSKARSPWSIRAWKEFRDKLSRIYRMLFGHRVNPVHPVEIIEQLARCSSPRSDIPLSPSGFSGPHPLRHHVSDIGDYPPTQKSAIVRS